MVKRNFKKGYTLFEACVVMLIVSIFIMVMANVIPHKVKNKVESQAHGHFECYWEGGKLYQQMFIEGKTGQREERTDVVDSEGVPYCQFDPIGYTHFLIFNAVGSGAQHSAGRFASTFFNTSTSSYYKIYVFEGGTASGEETYIQNDSGNVIMRAGGGVDPTDAAALEKTSIEDVSDCIISSTVPRTDSAISMIPDTDTLELAKLYDKDYVCEKGPLCEIENGKIKVSYCRSGELYKTKYLPYKKETISGSGSGTYVDLSSSSYRPSEYVSSTTYPENHWNSELNQLTYCDTSLFVDYGNDPPSFWKVNNNCESNNENIPSMYKMVLTLSLSKDNGTSYMSDYIKMLQYDSTDDPIAGLSPGPGDGVATGSGGTGAVLILW